MRVPKYAAAVRLLASVAALLVVCGCAATRPDPRHMQFAPVTPVEPDVEKVVLENGMTLYLLSDRELPLIRIHAIIHTGSVYEPANQVGLSNLTATMMREGGAGDLSPDDLDDALAFSAIRLGSSMGEESAGASLDSLTRTFPEALGYFADMLRRPRFDPDRLATQKERVIESIRRKNDRPGSIVRREFRKALFGGKHPLAREPTTEGISAITRDDLVEFHRHYYRPNQILLGITGDFDRDDMVAAIRDAFGDWASEEVELPEPPPVPDTAARKVMLVDKPADQVYIRMGEVSIRRQDPDYYALQLVNRILGGSSFMSRLVGEVRTKRGMAYFVGSAVDAGMRDRGSFLMAVGTEPDNVSTVINVMLGEVERLRTEPIPEQELAEAKESFLNAFVFKSVTPEQVVSRRMQLDYYGLPEDELTRLKERTLAVTPEQALAVSRKHLHPDRMAIVAVGNPDQLRPALEPFGAVQEVTLTEP